MLCHNKVSTVSLKALETFPPPSHASAQLYLHHCENSLVGEGICVHGKVSSVVVENGIFGLPVSCSTIIPVCHVHSTELVVVPVLHCFHAVLQAPRTEKTQHRSSQQTELTGKILITEYFRHVLFLRLTEAGLNCGAWLLISDTCTKATPSLVSPIPPISATCSFNLKPFTTYRTE